ncbi:ribonuclease D [Nocardioides marinus]|uniref:Ribonuclease D n=1 Tax=Nocardioides marinus TaxID=374514 RepID=A0A7Y9YB95_9ACTN|nr:HRDC domain-containing protein [Nocardioides marinus]NYI09043.1 ribonuclease D [Nocardioides marinus]
MSEQSVPHDPEQPDTPAAAEADPAPLLTLREPMPDVVETPEALRAVCEAVAGGTGPVAIDAERASGYRYSSRAYLIQLRREGSGTHLVDPIAFDDLAPLQEAIGETEWILHAATQDLPCLREEGLSPSALFDTELAGRLLGYPRVGLATLVETLLGRRMKKEHSAVDWSTRPLPKPWLEYAALDVEVLVELRDLLAAELEETGKAEWARQEFDALRSFEPTPRVDAWRRTSGLHKVRGRRSLGAVKALWELRDALAEQRDVTPGRILPDSAITVAATHLPTDKGSLLGLKGFHGRGAERYSSRWVATLREVAELPEEELPTRAPRSDGPPTARAWADRDPVAARRLQHAREAMAALAEEHSMPAEQLLTPDSMRRTLWTPPRTRDPEALAAAVAEQLRGYGARPWQVELTTPLLVAAILHGDEPVPEPEAPQPDAEA